MRQPHGPFPCKCQVPPSPSRACTGCRYPMLAASSSFYRTRAACISYVKAARGSPASPLVFHLRTMHGERETDVAATRSASTRVYYQLVVGGVDDFHGRHRPAAAQTGGSASMTYRVGMKTSETSVKAFIFFNRKQK
jgi:hypothetical protein